MKIKLILGIVLPIISLIATAGLYLQLQSLTQERIERTTQELEDAINDLDKIVERAILHCTDGSVIGCDKIMMEWYDECQKDNLKDVPSCHDGRIESYLLQRKLIMQQNSVKNELSTEEQIGSNTIPVDPETRISIIVDEYVKTCQVIYDDYQKMQSEPDDIKYYNWALNIRGKINDCVVDFSDIETQCQHNSECDLAKLSELKENLTEAKEDVDSTVAMLLEH